MKFFRNVLAAGLLAGWLVSCTAAGKTEQEMPLIGISAVASSSRAATNLTYVNSVKRAGGVPVVIPMTRDSAQLEVVLRHIQGLVMTGGEDINPKLYGHAEHPKLGTVSDERDAFDRMLIRMAVRRGIPLLGVCRGEQMLNVAFGGTLYQDIPSEVKDTLDFHNQELFDIPASREAHAILIEKGTLLYSLLGIDSLGVNSFHHQCVRDLAPGFVVSARSPFGVVEAIEMKGCDRILGVQFHPEGFTANGDDRLLPLFEWLIGKACEK